MAPSLGKWVRAAFGADAKTDNGKNTMRLQELVELLVQGRDDLKMRRHSAGADAQMHRLLLIEIIKLAGACG